MAFNSNVMMGVWSLAAVMCLVSTVASVPVYGTARYGRPAWAYRSAPAYYRQPYPFVQSYPDEMYYQPEPMIHYPYYAMTRPFTKNDVYQTLYPYYYSERPRPAYGYYSTDELPVTEDGHEDELRTSGADSLPVGQETWFEGESSLPRWQSDYDDVNAAFLQNLIMSQVYNDAMSKNDQQPVQDKDKEQKMTTSGDYDDRAANAEYYGERDTRDFEDEDVRELKALAGKPLYHVPKTGYTDKKFRQQQQWSQNDGYVSPSVARRDEDHYVEDYPADEAWINWSSKRSEGNMQKNKLRSTSAPVTTTTSSPATTIRTGRTTLPPNGGQKEEVLLRPATPVRHPFPEPVLQMLAANSAQQKKRTPSVYDTIKQMLSMDEPFAPKIDPSGTKNRVVQKRFVSTEEDLVGELKGLKRRSRA